MCGLAGILQSDSVPAQQLAGEVAAMASQIVHRGPDDSGVWVDERGGYAIAFRRLSIVDLTPEGHQPMRSACGRYVVAFNGEVYNHVALRKELRDGYEFRGTSDTEVILASVLRWGLVEALQRFVGMFAISLWDTRERILYLVRDRLGKKPLYYTLQNGTFLFASELKALRRHERFDATVSREALAAYLRFSYVPGPLSIYSGVQKLTPGTVLSVDLARQASLPRPVPYWTARDMVERAAVHPFQGTDAEAIEALEEVLGDAVKLRMMADVPVGAFLSGGIDSSLIVALMQRATSRPVRTFTIGFHENAYNEAEHAKRVADHLGTDHTQLYVTAVEAQAVIPSLPSIYDEPFADSSQIPTFLVSKLARRDVTVALSGDGGDELFGGYNRYFRAAGIWSTLRHLPLWARRRAAAAITAIPPSALDTLVAPFNDRLPRRLRGVVSGDRLHRAAGMFEAPHLEAVYRALVSHWSPPSLIATTEPPSILSSPAEWPRFDSPASLMMYLDLLTYLVDDILVKVDRASMAVSLEVRAPLLDHRVAEFAWRLPLRLKVRGQSGKILMRRLLDRYVPRALIERPKQGFGIPVGDWLRGPLRDWAGQLLSETRLRSDGYLNPAPIRACWMEHLEGRRNWAPHLWNIIVFQQWLETLKAATSARPRIEAQPM